MSLKRVLRRLRSQEGWGSISNPSMAWLLADEDVLIFDLLKQLERLTEKENLTMTFVTNNDNAARLRPGGFDRDGVAVIPKNLTASVDNPEVATVTPDPDNAGCFLVTPLPSSDPAGGARTVVVTLTDPATNLSVQATCEFDPGAEATLTVASEAVPLAQAQSASTANASAPGQPPAALNTTLAAPNANEAVPSANPTVPNPPIDGSVPTEVHTV